MSKLSGTFNGHHFHGAPERFEVVADFIANKFGKNIKYIADVAGGRGMLSRLLNKRYNYESEVIDPRGWALVGVPNRKEEFTTEMASYYDLVIGLHPDDATRPVVESALITNTLVVPCCNFWDKTQKLGRNELQDSIEQYYKDNNIKYEKAELEFKSPRNIGFLTLSHILRV